MSDQAWDSPNRDIDDLQPAKPVQWKVDRDPRDNEAGVRIYAIPGTVGNIRCVAKDVDPDDADLIVRLYDEYRGAQ